MTTDSRLPLPRFSVPERRRGLPVVALLAPLVIAAALWIMTSSPYAALFAVLSPVLAVAGLLDGALQHRRAVRRESARVTGALARARAAGERLHDEERRDRLREVPPLRGLLDGSVDASRLWSRELGGPLPVLVAAAEMRSRLTVENLPDDDRGELPPVVHDELLSAGDQLTRLADAPVAVDAAGGVAVVGPRVPASALARGIALQLAASLSPRRVGISAPADEPWVELLPHAAETGRGHRYVLSERGGRSLVVAVVGDGRDVPIGTGLVIRLDPLDPGEILVGGRPLDVRSARGAFLGAQRARVAAAELSRIARGHGEIASEDSLPRSVGFAELGPLGIEIGPGRAGTDTAEPESERPAVVALLGRDGEGPVGVDLVRDGPHAVVGGTTGSGKSELLVTMLLSLAACHPPDRLAFLLVDFKGGAGFAPVSGLPHVVGMLTDLDSTLARRAVVSLRAEVRRRERVLAERGARSLDDLEQSPGASPDAVSGPVLARMVVVVDEYAAMIAELPELQSVFADISARGRSLGLHLLLCTQRPAASVRDAVLANTSIRISLRVADAADSRVLLGSDAASLLPASERGRALVAVAGGPPRPVQVALSGPADVAGIAARHTGSVSAWRPWRDPLPARITPDRLPPAERGGGLVFGLVDHPEEQSQGAAVWRPRRQGPLLVLGGPGSGRTSALTTVAAQAERVCWLPADPVDAWAVLTDVVSVLPDVAYSSGGEGGEAGAHDQGLRVVVVDDLDRLLSRFDDEHRHAFAALLRRVAEQGRPVGIAVAAAARAAPTGQSLASVFGSRLLLALPGRDEHVLAGGQGAEFRSEQPPGRGWWRGSEVQVAEPRESIRPAVSAVQESQIGRDVHAVVTPRPQPLVRRLLAAGVLALDLTADEPGGAGARAGGGLVVDIAADGEARRPVHVGDVDAWQSRWSQLAEARRAGALLFFDGSAADVRALGRVRELPPPIRDGGSEGWLLESGAIRRTRVSCGSERFGARNVLIP